MSGALKAIPNNAILQEQIQRFLLVKKHLYVYMGTEMHCSLISCLYTSTKKVKPWPNGLAS